MSVQELMRNTFEILLYCLYMQIISKDRNVVISEHNQKKLLEYFVEYRF